MEMAAQKRTLAKSATAAVLRAADRRRERYNPLRGLDMPRAVLMMERTLKGLWADFQWATAGDQGVEATDPDLMTIIERTMAGVSDMDWEIRTAAETARGYDPALAEEQAAFLEESFSGCANLDDAVEHLVSARFRGYAHLLPRYGGGGWLLRSLEPLPQWHMARDGLVGGWAWNPAADMTPYADLPEKLAPEETVWLENRRPVNRIGLIKYVRAAVCEKDWDAFIDIYGIPGVFIIMPPNVPAGREDEYARAAASAAEAACGALPGGSDVKTLAEARGNQPFRERLDWLQKQLVLAGTGGMLTMLSEPTGIGGGASDAQSAVWQTIIRRVARTVERPLNRQYTRRALAALWPGRPALAEWGLRARQEKDASAAVQSIAALAAAGYRVDPEQVRSDTGYDVSEGKSANVADLPFRRGGAPRPDPALEALAADLAPLRRRIEAALALPDGAMLAELARIRDDAPALFRAAAEGGLFAGALERRMAEAFAAGAAAGAEGDTEE